LKLVNRNGIILIIFYVLGTFTLCYAEKLSFNVCKQVGEKQLSAIYSKKLYPTEQENGCQWSTKPGGMASFQIGVIESQKNLRDFFQKEIPPNFELKKINDLGDRGLMTVSEGLLDIILIRKGNRVLISTANSLYIKHGSERQKNLWDIYRRILKRLR